MQKVALVTGASGGIGSSIAKALAENNYNLILCGYRNKKSLEKLCKNISNEYGTKAVMATGDVSDEAFIRSLYETAMDVFGCPDVIINCAGISHVGLLQDMSTDEWDGVINVNLRSCFLVSRAFMGDMIKRQSGHIIQISSVWGDRGASCEVAYSTSKGGMNAFTKALAKELAPSHIAVNALSCGMIDTSMNAVFSDEEKKLIQDEIPWGKIASPEMVAECVISLLNMPYVTGQIIGVDGGW